MKNSPLFPALMVAICIIMMACKKTAPTPPTGLTVSHVTDTHATLSWNATGDGKYLVTYTGWGLTKTIATDSTVLVLSNLRPGTAYHIQLVAKSGNTYSPPAEADFTTIDEDALVIIGGLDGNVYAFNAQTGTVAWQYKIGKAVYASPVIKDTTIYIGSENQQVYALNIWNGLPKPGFTNPVMSEKVLSPITINNNTLYVGDYHGRFGAYDANSGQEKWHYNVPSPYANINSAAVIDNSSVYFSSYDGKVYALDTATGAKIWISIDTGNPISSGLTVKNNVVFVCGYSSVYAFNAQTGDQVWKSPASGGIGSFDASPTLNGDDLLAVASSGDFYALNTADGTVKWHTKLPIPSSSSPVCINNTIYQCAGGYLYALNAANGAIIWQSAQWTDKAVYSGPVVTDSYIYAADYEDNGTVFCFKKNDGTIKWSQKVGGVKFESNAAVIMYAGKLFHPGITAVVP